MNALIYVILQNLKLNFHRDSVAPNCKLIDIPPSNGKKKSKDSAFISLTNDVSNVNDIV